MIDRRPQVPMVTYYPTAALVVLPLLAAYMILKPYYLLPSGLPQVGDVILVTALPFVFSLPLAPQNEHMARFRVYLTLFSWYAAIVNISWTFVLMDTSTTIYGSYYVFNLCLIVICLRVGMLYPKATLLTIAYTISFSAVIQAALVAFTFKTALARQIAGFNNPNQLAYWSLLSLCMFWCIADRAKIRWYIQVPTAICLIYTSAVALSKAGMISVVLLCLLHFSNKPKLLILGLVALAPTFLVLENSMLVERISDRLQTIGQQGDDSIDARGYPRIIEYPHYLLLGAGEGGLDRFDNGGAKWSDEVREIHSTFGTILFSYGIFGVVTFGAAIWQLYRLSSARLFMYVLPPFLFGFTHQGLRFSFLWLLFSVIAILGGLDRGVASSPKDSHRLMTRSKEAA